MVGNYVTTGNISDGSGDSKDVAITDNNNNPNVTVTRLTQNNDTHTLVLPAPITSDLLYFTQYTDANTGQPANVPGCPDNQICSDIDNVLQEVSQNNCSFISPIHLSSFCRTRASPSKSRPHTQGARPILTTTHCVLRTTWRCCDNCRCARVGVVVVSF